MLVGSLYTFYKCRNHFLFIVFTRGGLCIAQNRSTGYFPIFLKIVFNKWSRNSLDFFYVKKMHFLHTQKLFTALSLILDIENVSVQQNNRNYIFRNKVCYDCLKVYGN